MSLPDPPEETNDVLAINVALRDYQPLIEQLCDSKPVRGDWGDEFWVAKEILNVALLSGAMRNMRLLRLRALLDLARNQPAEARREVEAILKIARISRRTPTLIMCLVNFSGTSTASDTVWHGLESGEWDDDTLRSFAAEFLAINAIGDFLWSMQTERAFSRELAERWIGNPDKIMAFAQFSNGTTAIVDKWLLQTQASRRSWWRDNQLWIERAQDELLATLDGEEQLWRPTSLAYDATKLTTREREGKLALAAMAMSAMPNFVQKAIYVHAQNKMTALACALELRRRTTGTYPETLAELVPAYLPWLPVDPVNGNKFRYRVQSDGTYLLYSVGLDREDQGGKVNASSAERDATDPDWPWYAPRPRAIASP